MKRLAASVVLVLSLLSATVAWGRGVSFNAKFPECNDCCYPVICACSKDDPGPMHGPDGDAFGWHCEGSCCVDYAQFVWESCGGGEPAVVDCDGVGDGDWVCDSDGKGPDGGLTLNCAQSDGVCTQGKCNYYPEIILDTGNWHLKDYGDKCGNTGFDAVCDRRQPAPECPGLGSTKAFAGDPVSVPGQAGTHSVDLLTIKGSVRPFTLKARYTSRDEMWGLNALLGFKSTPYLPKPFGASWTHYDSMRWWHNLYSLVAPDGWSPSSTWTVRDTEGELHEYWSCGDGGMGCFGHPMGSSQSDSTKLYWSGALPDGGDGFFTLFQSDGRYIYDKVWTSPDGGLTPRYFLGRIEDTQYLSTGQGKVVAQLSYATPADGGCIGLGGSPNGVPFLDTVTNEDGAKLHFKYTQKNSVAASYPNQECVLSAVALKDDPNSGSNSETDVVQFGYAADEAGLLASITWPASGRAEGYAYSPDGGQMDYSICGVSQVTHLFDPGGAVGTTGPYENYSIEDAGFYNAGGGEDSTLLKDTNLPMIAVIDHRALAGAGDGTAATVRTVQTLEELKANRGQVVRARETVVDGTSFGTSTWLMGLVAPSGTPLRSPVVNWKQADERGYWTYTNWAAADDGGMSVDGVLLQPERREVLKGTNWQGNYPLETVDYTYQYGGEGQTPSALEQLPKTESQDSVLQSGQKAVTTNVYDLATNRLKAVFRSGYTETFDATPGSWTIPGRNNIGSSVVQRTIGTFYFTNAQCSGGSTPDPMGRVVEVHGPCWVEANPDGGFPDDCNVTGNVPITQYEYYSSTETSNNRNRLHYLRRFTDTDTASCSGKTSLTTTYLSYNARGNLTEMSTANDLDFQYTYSGDQITQVINNGDYPYTGEVYQYENGKLRMRKAADDSWFELYCYRTGASDSCSGGAWTEKLQWKAKVVDGDASDWTEKVAYEYHDNGALKSESYYSKATGSAELRRVVRHEPDALSQPAYDGWGDSGDSGSFSQFRLFDGVGNLVGLGLPANVAPANCGGLSSGGPSSPLCAAFGYDRAERLTVSDLPVSSSRRVRACFGRDAQGNINSVKTGCLADAGYDPWGADPCSSCANGSAYQYDDFGNVVSATLPWMDADGGPVAGTVRYEYDARGNPVREQMPGTMDINHRPVWLETTYDALGRSRAKWIVDSDDSYNNELLYQIDYDASVTPPDGCPTPGAASQTNGRPQVITDSFGQTWYAYNGAGDVLAEFRLRSGFDGGCSGWYTSDYNRPNTFYVYPDNDHQPSYVLYPYGRAVLYSIGSDRRVHEVDVAMWNGSAWAYSPTSITNVAWEPYGGLRGYQINDPDGGATSVEYMLGDQGNDVVTSCPTSAPNVSGGDHSGRLRGLWVTKGAFTPGSPSSNRIYTRTYSWAGDQVSRIGTCVLGDTTPQVETYSYDAMLRLTGATGPLTSNDGGAFSTRSYTYDDRGNLTELVNEDCAQEFSYAKSGHPDHLTDMVTSGCSSSVLESHYVYDPNGVVEHKKSANDSSGLPNNAVDLFPGAMGIDGPVHYGATDSVYTNAYVGSDALNDYWYTYFYDYAKRRRMKVFPFADVTSEYFYSPSNEMLVDQGSEWDSDFSLTSHPTDDYVWLGGRPVMVVRGKLNTSWVRQNETAGGSCSREQDGSLCGVYYPVTDHIGKPVVVLDQAQRIAGVGEYDPLGRANMVSKDIESAHPSQYQSTGTLGSFIQHSVGGLTTDVRAKFGLVDTVSGSNFILCGGAYQCGYYATVTDGSGSTLSSPVGGVSAGKVWTDWVNSSTGDYQVKWNYGGSCHGWLGHCTTVTNYDNHTGVAMEGYEYRRYQSGATPYFIPLRFPGQYWDPETELAQNWNRFYDPGTGRYLEPEPLATNFPAAFSTYVYADGNPIAATDSTGQYRDNWIILCPNWKEATRLALKQTGCPASPATNGERCEPQNEDCKRKVDDCAKGCDLCNTIQSGSGPLALLGNWEPFGDWVSKKPKDKRGVVGGKTPMHVDDKGVFTYKGDPISFYFSLCYGESNIKLLASAMIHEAAHACTTPEHQILDDEDQFNGCAASDIEESCFGSRPGR